LQYTVGPSDTLYSIAKRFNTTVQQLEAVNNLQSPDLRLGQTIVITK
jgi:spore germination protein